MKESNFISKQNIDNSCEESVEEIKVKLESLKEDISEYTPETKEFSEIKENFIKIQSVIEKEVQKYIEREEASEYHFSIDRGYKSYFELIDKLDLLNESNKEMAAKVFMMSDHIDHAIANSILSKRQQYKTEGQNIDHHEGLAEYILKKFDFSEEEVSDLIQSWLSVEDDETADWYIYQNLKNIRGLENFENKSAKYLLNNFGIRGFGRYNIHELKKQYNERDNMEPYGVYFQGVMDWNGSFSQSNQSEDIREKVEENSFVFRVIEANGKIDLAKRLLFLRDKYKQKIKFMYMHVHGNTDVIGFGDKKGNNRMLRQEDLGGKGIQRVKELFENDAELVLSSCLTGVRGGLAEEMSKVYNVKVIAADKPTEGEPKSVDIKKNSAGSNLEFNIVFNTVDEDDKEGSKMKKGTVIYKPE
ncbi:MAG: hypothetical protein PHE20_01500 [Patescibacteria group bacterium]|nr:hypothetical protein [Patescibacteria group bacterium]